MMYAEQSEQGANDEKVSTDQTGEGRSSETAQVTDTHPRV